jgi:hypothetical protein
MNDRHVDQEISSVKTLYEGREKTISLERDDALAKVTVMQKVCFKLCLSIIFTTHFVFILSPKIP